MDIDLNELLSGVENIEEVCEVLHNVSMNYDDNSFERKAIELALYALHFAYSERTRASFRTFIENIHRPLSKKERDHLKAMNIDPDTGDLLH